MRTKLAIAICLILPSLAGCAQQSEPSQLELVVQTAQKQIPAHYSQPQLIGITYMQDGDGTIDLRAVTYRVLRFESEWGILSVPSKAIYTAAFTPGGLAPHCQNIETPWTATPADAARILMNSPDAQAAKPYLPSPRIMIEYAPAKTSCDDGMEIAATIQVTLMSGEVQQEIYHGALTITLDGFGRLIQSETLNPIAGQRIALSAGADQKSARFETDYPSSELNLAIRHSSNVLTDGWATFVLTSPDGNQYEGAWDGNFEWQFQVNAAPAGTWNIEGSSPNPIEWKSGFTLHGDALSYI